MAEDHDEDDDAWRQVVLQEPLGLDVASESEHESTEEMEQFQGCISIRIASQDLLCYHSKVCQCEFVTNDVAKLFFVSSNTKRLADRMKKNMEMIEDYHFRIWPGVPIKRKASKYTRVRPVLAPQQIQYFNQNTMSTSMTIAFCAFCIGHPKRQSNERNVSIQAFESLLQKLLVALGSVNFSARKLVATDQVYSSPWVTIEVDGRMRIDTSQFVAQEILVDFLRDPWASDFQTREKPWLRSPIQTPQLHEWIVFSLDPTHSEELKGLLVPNALSLMSQIASLLDMNVTSIGSEIPEFSISGCKKKLSTSVTLNIKKAIAWKVWKGEDWFDCKKNSEPDIMGM